MVNLLLLGAFIAALCGMAWLAVAMEPHWKQVRDGLPSAHTVLALRSLGAAALLLSLVLCLQADHASMAALVWLMLLAGTAMSVAFTLSWFPRALAPLVCWLRA